MNEYRDELTQEIDFLYAEMGYLQQEITTARKSGDTGEYTRLLRAFLPLQKQYLKLCAELDNLTGADVDELAAFNGA